MAHLDKPDPKKKRGGNQIKNVRVKKPMQTHFNIGALIVYIA